MIVAVTRGLALLAAAAVLALCAQPSARAARRVRWKMQSAYPTSQPVTGEVVPRFAENILRLSGGTLEIKPFEPGALVPATQGFEAVRKGSLDAMWGTAGFHVGRVPALAWFSAVPFGPGAEEYLAWLDLGGGGALYDRVYAAHGLKGLFCGMTGPEASGWFRREIQSITDFRGLRIRSFGLGGLVLQKLGASTQLLASADVFPALERGVLDATEFSSPAADRHIGLYQVAKHYYFPGWQRQATLMELLMSRAKWEHLSPYHRAIIEISCGDTLRHQLALSAARQPEALEFLRARGVEIHRWPPEILAALRRAWDEVRAEQSAKDPLFKEIGKHFMAFRKRYAVWKELGFVE